MMKRADEATDKVWGQDPNTPTTYASLGERKEAQEAPSVPGWLQVAPALLGISSVIIFILNSGGLFGEGPDLDGPVDGRAARPICTARGPRVCA